jgi:hypothetical protein
MTVINMFIIYLAKYKRRSKKPISHLQFMIELYEAFLYQWGPREYQGPPRSTSFCCSTSIEVQKPCVVCNGPKMGPVIRTRTYCKGCNNKYICFKKRCYKDHEICKTIYIAQHKVNW